jgi:hypothetical protein
LGEIGAVLGFLAVICVLGNLWFHFVEAMLGKIRVRFSSHREPAAWHPLPPEQGEQEDKRND